MDKLDGGYNLIFIYLLSALAGNVYETVMFLFRRRKFVFSNGSITTPFNFVYGIGAVAICASTIWVSDHWWAVMLSGALLGGIVEYILSFLEEKILHTRTWDYRYMKFNVNGRTGLLPIAVWGALSLLVLYGVYFPLVRHIVEPYFLSTPSHAQTYHTVLTVLICYCAFDLLLTTFVVMRYQRRNNGVPARNGFIRVIDKVFNDRYMERHFENTKVVKKTDETPQPDAETPDAETFDEAEPQIQEN